MKHLKWFCYLTIITLELSLLTAQELSRPVTALAQPLPAVTFLRLQPEPGTTGLWGVWYDQPALLENKAYISHYEANGRPFQLFSVPRNSALLPQSGFVFLPEAYPRFYYATYLPTELSRNKLLSLAYLDVVSGKTTQLTSSLDISGCRQEFWALNGYLQPLVIYNPELKHIYLPCYAENSTHRAALIIDALNDQIIGALPYIPLAYNPVNQRLYALKYYTDQDNPSFENFDLLALDAHTEKATSEPPLIANSLSGSRLSSLLVNHQTGEVFITRSVCCTKGSGVYQAVYDKTGQVLQNWSQSATTGYLLINETTNQLYGRHWRNGNYIAVNAANLQAGQVAAFVWTPLAVNTQYNRVYTVDNRDASSPFIHNHGLAMLIMDGTNYDIVDFFAVRPPDEFFLKYTERLKATPPNFQGIFIEETGHTLSGKFLQYWQEQGGLALFGYPISEVLLDYNSSDGQVYQVQYFERNRFEYHPENVGTPYEIELGLLGQSFSGVTGPEVVGQYATGETIPVPDGLLFKQTGHTLTGQFLKYWQKQGGLAIFGLPLTEPFQERNPADGQTYLVQYFERNRFEYHPQNVGTPYEVELGLLGSQYLSSRGWVNNSLLSGFAPAG